MKAKTIIVHVDGVLREREIDYIDQTKHFMLQQVPVIYEGEFVVETITGYYIITKPAKLHGDEFKEKD